MTQRETEDFLQCINSCSLNELKYTGSMYTWWNGRIDEGCIFKRLDRVLVNDRFLNLMPESEVHHLIRIGSDHAPLYVMCNTSQEKIVRPFKFLNFWTKYQDFKKIVEENWQIQVEGSPFNVVHIKLKKLKGILTQWNKETFGNVFRKIATLEDIIKEKEIQLEIAPTEENREELNRVNAELKRYLKLEEAIWKQNAGLKWFTDGERNTNSFMSMSRVEEKG